MAVHYISTGSGRLNKTAQAEEFRMSDSPHEIEMAMPYGYAQDSSQALILVFELEV